MDSVKTIRAVERAFEVLEALKLQRDGATLGELAKATGLSGPTLLRLLKTMAGLKVVRRSMVDQRWRTGLQLDQLARAATPFQLLADVAAPWLDWLCRKVQWPSDLAVHEGNSDHMVVLESNLRGSPFYVRRSPASRRVNLLGSAAGSAYLAALPQRRVDQLVAQARSGRDVHNLKSIALGDTERLARLARERGYASRHRIYRGGSYNGAARDDGLNAIAIPIVDRDRLIGALNINWNRDALTEAQLVHRSLDTLRQAAHGISLDSMRHGVADLLAAEAAEWDGMPVRRVLAGPPEVTGNRSIIQRHPAD